jgi:Ribosome biogenesis protein Nop16
MATPRQRKKRVSINSNVKVNIVQRSSVPKQTRKTKQKHKKIQILNDKIISQNWDKKQTLEQKWVSAFGMSADDSYERLGLAARPLELYTSGGVEKTKKGSTKVVVPKSEAVIRRNPDGSTNIVYVESDEEDGPAAPSPIPPETKVVKGIAVHSIFLICRVNGRSSSSDRASCASHLDCSNSLVANFDRYVWR